MTFQQTAVYVASLVLASTNVISPAVLDRITSTQPKMIIQTVVSQKWTTENVATQNVASQKTASRKIANQKLANQKLAAQKIATQKIATHLFQAKTEPRVIRKTIYDGPFKHGSPMLTHQEDTAAINDCFASFHLPNESADFSNAI
jgi:hypothetical protein